MAKAQAGKAVTASQRHLRVAYVWNGALQAEEELSSPRKVTLGDGPEALYPLPDGVSAESNLVVVEPGKSGYCLRLGPGMGGDLWLGGQRRNVRDVASQTSSVELGPDDYGVVTLGTVAFFFQHVKGVKALRRPFPLPLESTLVASMALSVFLFTALMVLMYVAADEFRDPDPLELPSDLIARFLVTPPPEDILEELAAESGTEMDDPGLESRDETGGTRHEGDEGRVGREDAEQEQTEIEDPHIADVAARVRDTGLLGALAGGSEGNAIAAALDVPNISDVISGLNSTRTVLGRGSGGTGLVGTGGGGGGDGQGGLFGAGGVGTGIGAGRGGLGMGMGGIGAKGRKRTERVITVQRGAPRVNGYLSPEQINRVVRANQAAIRYCYELQVQRQQNLRGRVSIQWRINLQGSVTSARVASSTLNSAAVEGCMVRQIRRWRFPNPDGGEVVVTYPFIFGVQGG
ncbi:MAG: AgmX/PglI C-terminal domain-containing protein [Deltaproteobacteria bacterium]|nr:AgmX/PglI C-terminal domain-containing protein [Deltaproteobacteria bacterium]